MARPDKKGLDYFPLDVNFMHDRKIRRVCRTHGNLGMCVVIHLFCGLYRENGYYLAWDDDVCFDIADGVGAASPRAVQAVVDDCLAAGLFDAALYGSCAILTSVAVQKRFKICSSRRCNVLIEPAYNLLDTAACEETKPTGGVCPDESNSVSAHCNTNGPQLAPPLLLPPEMPLLPAETTQRKGKQSKENQMNNPQPPSIKEGETVKEEDQRITLERMKELHPLPDYAAGSSQHNGYRLIERLYTLGVHSPADMGTLLRISRYGEIGHPLWGIIAHGKWAGEKKNIAMPGKYLIKVITSLLKKQD